MSIGLQRLIGRLNSANMNTTADQAISMSAGKYIIRRISVLNASTSLTTCVGGFYTGAGKTGTTLIAATQVYTTLTGSTKYLDLTLASAPTTDILTVSSLFFALTTGQGGAATADIYLFGDDLT